MASDRVIIYKKTAFLNSMTSCLIEISVINKKLLFMAYVMGSENFTSKLFLDEGRSSHLLNQCQGDFSTLGSKVTVDKHRTIRVSGLAPSSEKDSFNGIALLAGVDKLKKLHPNKH